ncbi:MAG: peptide ABC transporter permease [Deltaproteobacteria bacterium]|nr:peptide ABC transporter permease [Deltaproteobacteria bacterium]
MKCAGLSSFLFFLFIVLPGPGISAKINGNGNDNNQQHFSQLIRYFSSFNDTSFGSKGAFQISGFIKKKFRALGYDKIGSQTFSTPARLKTKSRITIEKNGKTLDLDPFLSNAISPDTIKAPGITGHVVYVKKGEMTDFNDKNIKNALVLMDIDSEGNWINALSLGAKAVIYIYRQAPDKFLFKDKFELSPVNFPRFILSQKKAEILFPDFKKGGAQNDKTIATITSDLKWTNKSVENIYCMIPGINKKLKNELVIVEGFYDTSGYIPGKSPGADQSCSIASLLLLADFLKNNPPERSVLLVATAAHGNALAGMREMIYSIDTRSRKLKKSASRYKKRLAGFEHGLDLLKKFDKKQKLNPEQLKLVQKNIREIIKTRIDDQSNKLMQLRLEKKPDEDRIKQLAGLRMEFKRFEGKNDLKQLTPGEAKLVKGLIPPAVIRLEKLIKNAKTHKKDMASAMAFRKLVKSKKIKVIISLHLSSHGNGIGAFNDGWLYEIKNSINAYAPYVKLNETLLLSGEKASKKLDAKNILKDTLRPSLHRSWQSYFKDRPALGGEVSRLAGFLGLTLATTNDARQFWDTPYDTPEKVDMANAAKQSQFISNLVALVAGTKDLSISRLPRNGFATIKGRANFLRHGAVFADAPAPESIVLSFQGPGLFYSMVDESGDFFIKGVATKKLTLHKVILEGYKFDPATGNTIWAVDKKKTTKARYRVKVTKKYMETDLIMFPCSQTTILNLLEPRTFRYMTKLQVLDARMDATPIRLWYSRIDTRSSIISSIYLQPGTRLKLALSDTLLTKKFILTHSDKEHIQGNGYRIDKTPVIAPTQFLAARDMWALLNPRINNLEEKGINNQKIRNLQSQGNKALKDAENYLETRTYDKFFKSAGNALALAGRVYDHVESIQKDVLYGVLFYIVLFAPFAFCMERLVFAFINIYKRIAGFTGILIILIVVIYNVHPAFELAYSPIVVILAFFIIGLSSIVTFIIFHHFENEMKQFHQQGKRGNEGEISLLKAFSASFFMGINNLRRRRVRTMLTCTTLIILTFTIMSFTSVKSIRQHSKLLYNDLAPYQGLLVKQINWKSLPERAFKVIENTMSSNMIAAPRVWLETAARTQSTKIPIVSGNITFDANGLIGLSPRESEISGLPERITKGRWFSEEDRYSIIIPERMARYLNLPDINLKESYIKLWSIPFKVIGTFSGHTFDKFRDLDGEPITPAIFPDEVFQKTTEAEMEAMESGDDIKAFQSRYRHIPFDQTVIIPYETLISLGGSLKSVALKYKKPPLGNSSTFKMVDRFGLWIFSGEKKGVFLYSASDNLNYSGLPNVLIPILISIFIVLNTMIGSVQERKREIGIYTSIGMAPSHVSIIFIAEALSYAVLSVVLGYILAQVIVKVFAGTQLLSGLTVNYSSLGGVFAMAMVMLVVLLSSIYPSKVAASIAIPDVEKSWELEKAKGNTLLIDLPFLIKDNEELSICGYLYNLFDTHRAVSHGIFSVDMLRTATGQKSTITNGRNFQIDFTAWLAPFDLGVMQDVNFRVKSSSRFKNYLEIGMTIVRKAGEHNTWWRVNKRFVNLIRKQLLIWRSMDDIEKKTFRVLMESHVNKKG